MLGDSGGWWGGAGGCGVVVGAARMLRAARDRLPEQGQLSAGDDPRCELGPRASSASLLQPWAERGVRELPLIAP